MSQSNIAHSLRSSLRRAGIKKFVSCTSIQKFAVTVTHDKAPNMRVKLCRQMMHSTHTAEKHNLNIEKEKKKGSRRVEGIRSFSATVTSQMCQAYINHKPKAAALIIRNNVGPAGH